MNTVKQIRLSKTDFIVDLEDSSLKLNYQNFPNKLVVDISNMNLIKATRVAIMCSTYCFIKNFKKKICWIVADSEIKRAISVLRLRNIEEVLLAEKEALEIAS